MNIRHLKFFCDTVKSGSVSKAAEINFVGQSAVSKAIRSLESELGSVLCLHQRNSFALTDEGWRVFQESRHVFDSVQKLRDSLVEPGEAKGDVYFSCQSSMAESPFLSKAIKQLNGKYPNLKMHLSLGRTDIVRDWLRDRIIDFAIVINNRNFKSQTVRSIGDGKFYLVKSPTYRGSWKNEGVLITEETKEVRDLRRLFSANNSKPLSSKMTVGSWGVIKNFALQGLGVGFVPDYLIESELLSKRLKLVEPSRYSVPYEIILVTDRDRYIPNRVQLAIREFCG